MSGLTAGIVFGIVLLLSAVSISSLRNLIPHRYRLAYILVITATWVTIVDLLLQAGAYDMRLGLDIYVPLMAMNTLVLMLLETEALRIPVWTMAGKALACSSAMLFVCVISGIVREVLVRGTVLSDLSLLAPGIPDLDFPILPDPITMTLFDSAAGAFIVLGCVIAMVNFFHHRLREMPDNSLRPH